MVSLGIEIGAITFELAHLAVQNKATEGGIVLSNEIIKDIISCIFDT